MIVLTSCSHRGVINGIKQAQAASGINKVHAVIGGFHLAPYQQDYVRDTITALKNDNIDYVIPLHCTGEPFYEIAKAEIRTSCCAPIRAHASFSVPEQHASDDAAARSNA